MQQQSPNSLDKDTEWYRRSIHDLAATLISVRALAETLAEHVPTLVAVSRARNSGIESQIPTPMLDALPSIPSEIVELCEHARAELQTIGNRVKRARHPTTPPTPAPREMPHSKVASAWTAEKPVGKRILLVEDEDTVRYVTSQTLQARGFHVVGACDGEEALQLLQEKQFDLVLMDLRIPGMSGWQTAREIRQRESGHGRRTRIVGLTASPLLEDRETAIAAGMDDVLIKPIDEPALQSLFGRFS